MIGLGTTIEDVDEFVRRARIALNGVEYHKHCRITPELSSALRRGVELSADQLQELVEIVHRHRRQITDVLVRQYAAARSKS